MIALLLAAATPQTAVEAERAFAADAKALGQWTAFRKWAADDAVMFLPQPSSAQAFLAPLKDPPRAVAWQPAESYVSCDGTIAANTGPTRWPDGRVGYFSTIWRKAGEAWRWTVDHGDFTDAPRWDWSRAPKVRRASCGHRKPVDIRDLPGLDDGEILRGGQSPDNSLKWHSYVSPDGSRALAVSLWNGRGWEQVINDRVSAPKP